MSAFESIPTMDLNPVAYAMEGRTVGGYPVGALLRVADAGVVGTASALTSANFTELQNLINGTSTNYMSSSSSSTGARLPTYSGSPATPASGSMWYDTSSGTIKFFTGTTTETLGTGSGSGTITGLTTSAPLSGSGTAGSVNISLSSSGVTAGSYGSSAAVPVLTVDAFGRVTAASTATISGVAPGGTAGGDLSGSYPSPTVAKIQGVAVSATAPSSGQVMKYNGTNWGGALLSMSDIYASDSTPVITNAACTSTQSLYLDSVTGHFQCQSIGGLNASAITSGTLAAGVMPAFTGDATTSAGSTSLTLAASGATAGTYKSVTVDAKGRVTAGSNPTTLGGFGITDGVQNTGGLPSMAAGADASKPTAGTAGRLYVASDTFKIYRDNGTSWDLISSAAGSGGTITGVTAGTALSGGGTSGNVTLNLTSVGTAGTYPKVTTDTQGRVTAGAALAVSDIPALPWSQITSGTPTTLSGYGITNGVANAGAAVSFQAGTAASRPAFGTVGRFFVATDTNVISYDTGSAWQTISSGSSFSGSLSGDVTGTQSATVISQVGGVTAANVASGANLANAATNLNTASTIVKRDASGNFAAGAVSEGSSIFRDSASNSVTLAAPSTVTTSYSLTLPPAKASVAGQVLSSDTSGVLSWVTPAVTSGVSVTAPITNSGSASAPNIGISQATTSTNGYLSSADWNTFTAKLSNALTSAYLFIGNASNVATGVALSGDATLSNAGALTVTGIKGKTVSAAPTTAGQVLRYDGTNITPNFLSMADLRSTVTGSSALTTGCTASQTLTWNSGTDNLMCQSISVAAATQITGLLLVANGGTGASSTSQGFVFAGPTGGSGAPTFRALASTDLPAGTSTQWTTSGSSIYYNTGNVGVGTSSPGAGLTLQTGIPSTNDVVFQINSASGTTQSYLGVVGTAGDFVSSGTVGDTFLRAQQNLFLVANTSGTPSVTLQNNTGNVGINNPAPSNTLSIQKATTSGTFNDVLLLDNNYNGTYSGSSILMNAIGTKGVRLYTSINNANSGSEATDFGIQNYYNGAWSDRFRISASGNIGIGTTSPGTPLDVRGSAETAIAAQVGGTGTPRIQFYGDTGAGAGAQINFNTGNGGSLATANGSGANIYIKPGNGGPSSGTTFLYSGNVGIGTTAPATSLDVNGAVSHRGIATASAPAISPAGQGRFYFDSTLNQYMFSQNGSAYAALATTGGTSSQTFAGDVTMNGSGTGLSVTNAAAVGTTLGVTGLSTLTGGFTSAGVGNVTNTTTSTSSTTGALKVAGGLGVAGDIFSGATVNAATSMMAPQIYGSTAASGTLKLDGTSNATKGYLLLNSAGGNVGIGTTAPGQALEVNGSAVFGSSSASRVQISAGGGATAIADYYTGEVNPRFEAGRDTIASGIAGVAFGPGANSTLQTSGAGIGMSVATPSTLALYTSNGTALTERMRVTPAGNVGIGTSAPANTFQVNGGIVTNGGASSSSAAGPSLSFYDSSSTGYIESLNNGTAWLPLVVRSSTFSVLGSGSAQGLYQNSGGSVGIGTTVPNASLDVNGSEYLRGGYLYQAGSGGTGTANSTGGPFIYADTNNTVIKIGSGNGNIILENYAGTVASVLSSNGGNSYLNANGGNVGIGTTNPNNNGSGGAGPFVDIYGSNPELQIGSANTTAGYTAGYMSYYSLGLSSTEKRIAGIRGIIPQALSNNPYGDMGFETSNGGSPSEKMRLTAAGNFGIGTATPTTTLQVAGIISPSADNTYTLGTSALRFTTIYATNGTVNTSDARLKRDVQDSDLGLEFIRSLRPVSYFWKQGDQSQHYGLIAQEADSAIKSEKEKTGKSAEVPAIVDHDAGTDRYGIRYTELISPLIKAVQELYKASVDTSDKMAEKDRQIASLKAQVDADHAQAAADRAAYEARLQRLEKFMRAK